MCGAGRGVVLRMGIGDVRGVLAVGRVQFELANAHVLGDDAGDRRVVAEAEPEDGRGEGMDAERAEERCWSLFLRWRSGQKEKVARGHDEQGGCMGSMRGMREVWISVGIERTLRGRPGRVENVDWRATSHDRPPATK